MKHLDIRTQWQRQGDPGRHRPEKIRRPPHRNRSDLPREHLQRNGTREEGKSLYRQGDLVPDDITIPMILDRLQSPIAPRAGSSTASPATWQQAEAMWRPSRSEHELDFVARSCSPRDRQEAHHGPQALPRRQQHPKNIFIDAIKPAEKGGKMVWPRMRRRNLKARADNQERAPSTSATASLRHQEGSLAAVNFFKAAREGDRSGRTPGVKEVSKTS